MLILSQPKIKSEILYFYVISLSEMFNILCRLLLTKKKYVAVCYVAFFLALVCVDHVLGEYVGSSLPFLLQHPVFLCCLMFIWLISCCHLLQPFFSLVRLLAVCLGNVSLHVSFVNCNVNKLINSSVMSVSVDSCFCNKSNLG